MTLTRALFAGLALAVTACSSVQTAAVPTGALRLAPRSGPVQIYAAHAPVGGVELGVVEVTASGEEATVDQMLPLFVQRVAGLGGNAAVIDAVRGRIQMVSRPLFETFYYACGFRTMCSSTRVSAQSDELLVVVMRGKAVLVKEAGP